MLFNEIYTYLDSGWLDYVNKGYAKLDLYSLQLNGYFTDEEKKHNLEIANTMTPNEYSNHCEQFRTDIAEKITKVVDLLNSKFSIYQYSNSVNYNSAWDLFFWCNCNGKERDMSYCTLSFNKNATIETKYSILNAVKAELADLDIPNIAVGIQYSLSYNDEIIQKDADSFFDLMQSKQVEYRMLGKGTVRIVSETNNIRQYGFFKNKARKRFYPLTPLEVIEIYDTVRETA